MFSTGSQLEQREWMQAWKQHKHTELWKMCQNFHKKKFTQTQKSKNNAYSCTAEVFYHTVVLHTRV